MNVTQSNVSPPRYSIAIIVSLSVGIAGITVFWTILDRFASIYGYLERDRLVRVMEEDVQFGFRVSPQVAVFEEWNKKLSSFEHLAGLRIVDSFMRTDRGSQVFNVALVGPGLLEFTGVSPIVGRSFNKEDYGRESVAMVSSAWAKANHGSAQEALRRILVVDGRYREIVGVFEASLGDLIGQGDQIEVALPTTYDKHESMELLGRLRPGVSTIEAQMELDAWRRSQPSSVTQEGRVRWVALSRSDLMDSQAFRLFGIAIVGGVISLVAMASSVGHLLGAKAENQRKELATRWALGSGRWLLFRWRVRETVILALISSAVAAVLAEWGLRLMTASLPANLRFLEGMKVEGRAFALAVLAGFSLSLVFAGLLNVFRAEEVLRHDLRVDQRFVSGSHRALLGSLNIISVVAFAFIIGVAAYLVVGTVLNLRQIDPGFSLEGLQALQVKLPEWKFADQSACKKTFERVVAQLSLNPKIESITVSSQPPSEPGYFLGELTILEREKEVPGPSVLGMTSVDARYFETLRQTVIAGQSFTEDHIRTQEPVVVISESLAKIMGPHPSLAVGSRIRFNEEQRQVIGVVSDVHAPGNIQALKGFQVYWPLTVYRDSMTVLVRAQSGHIQDLPRVLQRLDADIVVESNAMKVVLYAPIADIRFLMVLVFLMAIVTVVLAIVAVYSTLSNFTNRQRGQIALRMAIGAGRQDVTCWVAWKGMSKSLIGVVVGFVFSYPACQLLSDQLYGMESGSAPARIAAAILVIVLTACATVGPAVQASRTLPGEILKAC